MIYREVMPAGRLELAAVAPATIVIWWIALPEGHFLLGAPPEVSSRNRSAHALTSPAPFINVLSRARGTLQ